MGAPQTIQMGRERKILVAMIDQAGIEVRVRLLLQPNRDHCGQQILRGVNRNGEEIDVRR